MDSTLIKIIETLNIDAVQETIILLKDKGNDLERIKASIERILRTKALEFGCSTICIAKVDDFVKFVIGLAEKDIIGNSGIVNDKDNKICSKTLTIQILQDIFDISTTQRCEQLFVIIENNIHIWKTPFFFSSCKNMILRLCNDLLKRLSRFIDTTFCGRILILLAKSLPLNEKSGLNLPGHFNTQNVTVFDIDKKHNKEEQQPSESLKQEENAVPQEEICHQEEEEIPSVSTKVVTIAPGDEDMEIGEIRDHRSDSIGGGECSFPMDYNLYYNFWDLQRFFSNPNLLFEAENFTKFEQNISNVFSIFAAYKIEKPQQQKQSHQENLVVVKQEKNNNSVEQNNSSNFINIKKEVFGAVEEDEKNNNDDGHLNNNNDDGHQQQSCLINFNLTEREASFCAKYLTSEKLFSFQMSDSQFRRYFLLQFLIINNYLVSRTRPKEAPELTIDKEDKLQGFIEKCLTLLKETYPNGSQFASCVKKLLNREKLWCSWKADGFPDLIGNVQQLFLKDEQFYLNNKNEEKQQKQFSSSSSTKNNNNLIIDLGNKELTRLWTIEKDNLIACKNIKRKNIPNLKTFLEDALDELDPEQQVEEKYLSVNDEHYQWMANRFLLMNSDQHINHSSQDSSVKMTDKLLEKDAIASFLKKSIQIAAESVPELKLKAQQIQASIDKIKKQQENERLLLLEEQTKQQIISTTKTLTKESEKHHNLKQEEKQQIKKQEKHESFEEEKLEKQQQTNNNNNTKHVSTTTKTSTKESEQIKHQQIKKEEKLGSRNIENNNKKTERTSTTSTKRKHKSDDKRNNNNEEKQAKNPRK